VTAATAAVNRPPAGTEIPIPVRQKHIDNGMPGEACGCAVALAIEDAFPGAESVSVCYADGEHGHANARVWIAPGAWLRLVLGLDGWQLLRAFDAGDQVEPCTLTAVVA
jgi:hypothetical protein